MAAMPGAAQLLGADGARRAVSRRRRALPGHLPRCHGDLPGLGPFAGVGRDGAGSRRSAWIVILMARCRPAAGNGIIAGEIGWKNGAGPSAPTARWPATPGSRRSAQLRLTALH